MIQKIWLKIKYPKLKFTYINSEGGIYSNNGGDTFLLTRLINFLNSNSAKQILEIDNELGGHYSLTNIFVNSFSCNAYLINTNKHVLLIYGKNPVEMPNLDLSNDISLIDDFGITGQFKLSSRLYTYPDKGILLQSLNSNKIFHVVILTYNLQSLEILKQLLEKSEVYFIYLQNNSSGIFSLGDYGIRDFLLLMGYVYHSRLNNTDDFFVLSDFVNGFPSNKLRILNTTLLQKYICEPPESDYTKPR